jgi:hypothetical protein
MKRNRTPEQVPSLKDHAFVFVVVSNISVPWLAPLGTIILSWLIAGIVLDASGLFFHHWFCMSCAEQVGRRTWLELHANTRSCLQPAACQVSASQP